MAAHASNRRRSCWDGKNLDSPNHKDHVGYPAAGPAGFDPSRYTCPDTHPVKIPQLMLEVGAAPWDFTGTHNTDAFNRSSGIHEASTTRASGPRMALSLST